MRLCCPYCHGVGYHKVGCPEYEPVQSSYICCECSEPINIGDVFLKNDEGEYIHRECIPGINWLADWLGYKFEEMEDFNDDD